jgi:hypothetical protein
MSQRTPDWMLERIALGELPPHELAAARARLAQEPEGLERLARLEADTAATLERHPPARVLAEVERRRRVKAAQASAASEERPSPLRRLLPTLALGVPVAASLALLFIATTREVPGEDARTELSALESTRIKGDAQLLVHRQGAEGPERLDASARAKRGDLLQLGYNAGGKRYGAVLSLDGRGTVTLHLPEAPRGSLELKPGAVSLPHAYELDDAPAFERFVLVTSDQPFDLDAVLTTARALAQDPAQAARAPLALPAPLSQTSVTVEKVP